MVRRSVLKCCGRHYNVTKQKFKGFLQGWVTQELSLTLITVRWNSFNKSNYSAHWTVYYMDTVLTE